MSPLFMDTVCEPCSPGSLSAEESHSNTAGSEREGDGEQTGPGGTKRREKNRNAARKSRQKQTERADELHEELQQLERSNSALQKEVAALKKELHLYKTALDRHEPNCRLRAAATSSTSSTHLSASSSAAGQQTSPTAPRFPPQTLNSTSAASPSLSTSSASSSDLRTLKCVKKTHFSLSTSAPMTTTLSSPAGSSAELFTASSSSSSPVTGPYSVSFSTHPLSLFSEEPLFTSRPTDVMPACTSLVSNPVPPTAAQLPSQQDSIHETSSVSANAGFTVDAFLTKEASFLAASPNMAPTYSHLEADNTGVVAQGCPMNVPQLHPCQFSGSGPRSSPPSAILPSPLQGPAPQPLSVSPQSSLETSPVPPFALNLSYNQQVTPSPGSLLSLLTVPGPLNISQTTSRTFDGAQPPPSLPQLGDPSKDISLSELLEINDWILSGPSNQ